MNTYSAKAFTLGLFLLLFSCKKDSADGRTINGNNRVQERSNSELSEGIQNISIKHSMSLKAQASSLTYEYKALASPPSLAFGQTSATSIIREGNLVYIGWHTHDPRNYNGFAKYSGAVSCYEVIAGNWTLINRIDFAEMDIHEISLGAANELYIVGQSNPEKSGYDLSRGHRGAIVGRLTLDGSGHPTAVGYIERPLVSFGANSIAYVNASEIYIGTGNSNGYLYKMNNNLIATDSVLLDNVKSIKANNITGKLGLLRGNRGSNTNDSKFYEWSFGAALPGSGSGTNLSGVSTILFERNEADYYNSTFLASSTNGLIEVDPAGPTVSTVYSAGKTLSVAADTDNEVIYLAAETEGLKVLYGTGLANEYQVIGTFAPLSLNGGNWYVSDVVYDANNVFLTSGAGDVIFTEIYPETYYLNINMQNDALPNDFALVGSNLILSPDVYDFEIVSSAAIIPPLTSPWNGVLLYTKEIDAVNTPSSNFMTSLNGIAVAKTIDLSNYGAPVEVSGFFAPGSLAAAGVTEVKVTRQSDNFVFTLFVDAALHTIPGDIASTADQESLPPGRYSIRITSTSAKFTPAQINSWEGAFIRTSELAGLGGIPTDNYLLSLNGLNQEVILDLSNKLGNTPIEGFMVTDNVFGPASGSVIVEIRALHL